MNAASSDQERLLAAFPASISRQVEATLQLLPRTSRWTHRDGTILSAQSIGSYRRAAVVRVHGESVDIPYRMYNDDLDPVRVHSLPPVQRTILGCLYTRHDDGHTRQRWLRTLFTEPPQPWAVPFVIQLLGEYVIEIIADIDAALAAANRATMDEYRRFAEENPEFVRLTQERANSYWVAYFRRRYTLRSDCPGQALLASLAR